MTLVLKCIITCSCVQHFIYKGTKTSNGLHSPSRQNVSKWEPSYDFESDMEGPLAAQHGFGGPKSSRGAIPKYNRRLPSVRKMDKAKDTSMLPMDNQNTGPVIKSKMRKKTVKPALKQIIEEDPGEDQQFFRRSKSEPALFKELGCQEDIAIFLNIHKDFLKSYILKSFTIEELEALLRDKTEQVHGRSSDFNRGNIPRTMGFYYNQVDSCREEFGLLRSKRKLRRKQPSTWIFNATVTSALNSVSLNRIVYNFVKHFSYKVETDAIRVYVLDPENSTRVQYMVAETRTRRLTEELLDADEKQTRIIIGVATKSEPVFVSKGMDLLFPETPQELFEPLGLGHYVQANHVMYLPIFTGTGHCGYVAELWRVNNVFEDHIQHHASSFSVWVSVALNFVDKYMDMTKRLETADSMLMDVKSLFEDMVSLDQVIRRILELAQKLVKADRASLFQVDERTQELVSTVFDLKLGTDNNMDVEKKEIRIPIHCGIAGHVACTGETMNISNAYKDPRFNRKIDQETGYKTNTILCMPVKVNREVVGIVQMVNKRGNRRFLREDEVSFERCAPFFGLALHHAKLYEQIKRKEHQNRVTLDVLSYHNTCRQEEAHSLVRNFERSPVNLVDYYLDPFKFSEMQKCKAAFEMFCDLFGEYTFDVFTVARFVLTVKKNYRPVPYHNFNHGWSVANSMFVILKTDNLKRYSFRQALALFVAAYCHDLDHRGFTNQYMSETASPLAAMYTTSTLEHHHFNISVTILQQEGHKIFSHMSPEEYKDILQLIRHNILATDLANFFPNMERLKRLLPVEEPGTFDWENDDHRKISMALCMTAADLSASAKPWQIQKKTVNEIFEEFYNQGDKERENGKEPMPMMDRTKKHEQPASQVGFLNAICKPCYQKLAELLPNTAPLLSMVTNNIKIWEAKMKIVENGSNYSDSTEGTLIDFSSPAEDLSRINKGCLDNYSLSDSALNEKVQFYEGEEFEKECFREIRNPRCKSF